MARISRLTKQKETIAKEIGKINSFFSADDLVEKTKEKGISKATIYRYLSKANEEGELFSYTCNNKKIYSKGKKSHCHFECEETGKIIHFDLESIDFIKEKIPGTITSFQLEVKGVCSSCKKEK